MKKFIKTISFILLCFMPALIQSCDWENVMAYVSESRDVCTKVADTEEEIWNAPINYIGHLNTEGDITTCFFIVVADKMCLAEAATIEIRLIVQDNFPNWSLLSMKDLTVKAFQEQWDWEDNVVSTDLGISSTGEGIYTVNENASLHYFDDDSNFGRMGVHLELAVPKMAEPYMGGYIFEAIISSVKITINYSH
ncbi:MAG: hypothetical protein KAH17_01990 [Bacteroidales bacterium]|nr:hypothetical protein [Bacteroidales bacterium]